MVDAKGVVMIGVDAVEYAEPRHLGHVAGGCSELRFDAFVFVDEGAGLG